MASTTIRLAAGDGFAVDDLRVVERARSWTRPEAGAGYRLVFVRRGLFGLRVPGWSGLVDPLAAYLRRPEDEQRIAHRPGAEDLCTVLTLDGELAAELGADRLPRRPLRTDPRIDLAQRVVLAGARRGGDGFGLAERVVRLVRQVSRLDEREAGGGKPSHRRLAESAREALAADPAWPSFTALAGELGVSRAHLSRVFRAEVGESLTRYRARLRVRAVLDRIEDGEANLARLAAELGFADHAHLTRTVRAELGRPPARLRALLG